MAVIGQDRVIVWYQPDGSGTKFVHLGVGEKAGGMTGKSIPAAQRTPVYGRSSFGKPILIKMNTEAPTDLPTATLMIFERAQMDFLRKALNRGCPINIQTRITTCGRLDNPNTWDVLDHWGGGQLTQFDPGDGPSVEYNGEQMMPSGQLAFTHVIRVAQTRLSGLTIDDDEDILAIAGLPDEDCAECGNGYPGADMILYVGAAADTGAPGMVYVSQNGGGVWTALNNQPFANDEDTDFLAVKLLNENQIRLIAGTGTTDISNEAKIAYATIGLGAEGTATWTTTFLEGTENGDVVSAMGWLTFDRLYVASDGDIYLSLDQGETVEDDPIYSGATAINGFSVSVDESQVWAFGASNLILREMDQSGVFETRVGPASGGAFSALSVAGDGKVYAGNGTSIFVSTDGANSAGNWTELRDFGTNRVVRRIQVMGGQRALGGDSELLRVVVDNTDGAGEVWESVDGGSTFNQVPLLANTGYADAYFSEIDDNLGIIVGDDGVIQRLAPRA